MQTQRTKLKPAVILTWHCKIRNWDTTVCESFARSNHKDLSFTANELIWYDGPTALNKHDTIYIYIYIYI